VEMTTAQRQVDNIGDCGDNDRSTFFQEPGWRYDQNQTAYSDY